MSHKWSEADEILALWLYYALPFLGEAVQADNPNIVAAAKIIGVSPASIVMKLGNCAALNSDDPKKGLSGKSKQSEKVFQEYFHDKEKLSRAATSIIR